MLGLVGLTVLLGLLLSYYLLLPHITSYYLLLPPMTSHYLLLPQLPLPPLEEDAWVLGLVGLTVLFGLLVSVVGIILHRRGKTAEGWFKAGHHEQ